MNDKVFVKESYKILEGTAVFKDGSVDEVKNVYVYSKINVDPWVEELEAENERLKGELKQTEVQDQVVIDTLRRENEKLKCLALHLFSK